ncbi:hypothetical protein CKAN_00491800 [Cinnamomum micranthum f. kanehirae]|uniref:Uncharacterized protein n=1 Tax=Cinnamomum micranthum f. kanehirae TaxID=337451 RepID=A0A3S3PZI0_9MAGN|nr:hypothetical protein CKAN_00491800 [Cinnamomum micranthum f. kanehirae]
MADEHSDNDEIRNGNGNGPNNNGEVALGSLKLESFSLPINTNLSPSRQTILTSSLPFHQKNSEKEMVKGNFIEEKESVMPSLKAMEGRQ